MEPSLTTKPPFVPEVIQPPKSPDSKSPLVRRSTPSPKPALHDNWTFTGLFVERCGGDGLLGAGGVLSSVAVAFFLDPAKTAALAAATTWVVPNGAPLSTSVTLKAADV